MKWQFLTLAVIVGTSVLMVWRSAGKKNGCGCNCGCAHEADAGTKKENAAR